MSTFCHPVPGGIQEKARFRPKEHELPPPRYVISSKRSAPRNLRTKPVISSERSESRNLRISFAFAIKQVRRSLDSASLHSG